MLRRLNPSYGSYLGVAKSPKSSQSLIGHMGYRMGDRSARLTYLLPEAAAESTDLFQLVESMAFTAGDWGAFNLLAEIEESQPALDYLRRSGFGVYSWQQVWHLPVAENSSGSNGKANPSRWRSLQPGDELSVHSLYQCLVPPLVQSAEEFPIQRPNGFIYQHKGDTLAFVEGVYGPRGIYLIPLIHPSVENVGELLAELPQQLSPLLGRPVFLAVRSYHSWLESSLDGMGASAGPRQALLVKHLVNIQRSPAWNHRRGLLEHVKTEPTSPMVHTRR
jgi:hypothetical protein